MRLVYTALFVLLIGVLVSIYIINKKAAIKKAANDLSMIPKDK